MYNNCILGAYAKMEVEFDVHITGNILFDYMLHHTYSSLQGLLGTVVGALMIVGYFMNGAFIYLLAGLVIVLYLPCNLFIKAHTQAKTNESFKKPLHFKLTEEGVEVSQEDAKQTLKWEEFYKATSTRNSIVLYFNRVNAWIFPKADMDNKATKVIEMISTHMPPAKVKIRGWFS